VELLRSAGSCVAHASGTGQVLRWHLRIMMHPGLTSAQGETKFFRPQQGCDGDIAPVQSLPSVLHADAAAQIVHDEHLLRFRETEFPRSAGDDGET